LILPRYYLLSKNLLLGHFQFFSPHTYSYFHKK
jgi:hypothetical protein